MRRRSKSSNSRTKIAVVVGTRPDAIKLAPVLLALDGVRGVETVTVSTGQHRDMVRPALAAFGLAPDIDLEIGRANQTLAQLASRLSRRLDDVWRDVRPDWVVVQGDTTSAMLGALSAYHRRIRVAHVEAGLRTGRLDAPFPEEGNRKIIDALADLLFAPTSKARANLLREGISRKRILVSGNTIVDAVDLLRPALGKAACRKFPGRPLVVVTLHRRESLGAPLRAMCRALRRLADRHADAVEVVWPVHPNPQVRGVVAHELGGAENVTLVKPLAYREFLALLRDARLVVTDSGGIQEEAFAFDCPVLVLRDVTERVEGLAAGRLVLVGVDGRRIVEKAGVLLRARRDKRQSRANPFGDGGAAPRIVAALLERFTGE